MSTTTSGLKAYDIIGDIHGCHNSLLALLDKLGYSEIDGSYQHPKRMALFLGDFVDRCGGQRDVIEIVRPMVEAGTALSVMGNHEFNAIAYHTKISGADGYLREHSEKNKNQHKAFLNEYEEKPDDYNEVIQWFKTLPIWLDLGSLKVVHACWDREWIDKITNDESIDPEYPTLTDVLLERSSRKGTWQYEAIETLLKGKEVPLKQGMSFKDKDGNPRHAIRVKWWDSEATSYKAAFMGPESARVHIPDDPIEGDHLIVYSHKEVPVFLGHYWMEGNPDKLAKNIACLDYSVAKPGGKLVAYRWDGEQTLSKDKFVWVRRDENDINIV